MDFTNITNEILAIIEREEPILRELSEEIITKRFNNQNRSIKMLVGHLVDSASNNHQRMVRLQYAPCVGHSIPNGDIGMLVFPDYTQDNNLWISLQDYQHEDREALINLWKYANLHIIQVIKSVDASKLDNYWLDYEGNKVTLRGMIEGYVEHIKLHIGHIHELIR